MVTASVRILAAAVVLLGTRALAADQTIMTDQQRGDAMIRLHWLEAGTYKLPSSASTLALPQGYHVVLGEDAKRMVILSGDPVDNSVEAIAVSPNFKDEIVFQSVTEGYVSLDDWDSVKPSEMISTIRTNTENANKERRRQGVDEVHVAGWIQEPTLDRNTNTVYWAIEGSTSHGSIVNAIALRLGRNGYERFNWIVDKAGMFRSAVSLI